MRFFIRLLALEIGLSLLVTLIFSTIAPKETAALVAGSIFVLLGLGILLRGFLYPVFRKSMSFWAGLIHLFVSSLPLWLVRIFTLGEDFHQVKIFGIPGPAFHGLAESIYLLLILATIVDLIRAWREQKSLPAK